MSYVFSKALTRHEDERLKAQSLNTPNKVPPPVSCKPSLRRSSQPPPVKRKPLTKSHSVDNFRINRSNSVDLTVLGGSEWKDFVLRKEKERESKELIDQEETNGDSRLSPTSSNISCTIDGVGETTTKEARRRSICSSSFGREARDTIVEGRVFRRASSISGRNIRINSVDLTQAGDGEWKRISERKEKERLEEEKQENDAGDENHIDEESVTIEGEDSVPQIVDGVWKKVISSKDEDVTQTIHITRLPDSNNQPSSSQIVDGEWKKAVEVDHVANVVNVKGSETNVLNKDIESSSTIIELPTVPEQTDMDGKNNAGNAPPLTLPKPRKIGAELKRNSFARTASSSQSKSFAVGDNANVIKRSSEMVNESKNAPRSERSLSFDTQVPYFCRLSRALSIELEETLTQCEVSLKASARKASVENVIEEGSPISPILTIPEEGTDVTKEIEQSPDVIAMKNEIAIERSKKELERKKLSDTIDEIENFDFDFDTLIKPESENTLEETSQSQGSEVAATSEEVEVFEEPPTPSHVTNEMSAELKISEETSPENLSPSNEAQETSIEKGEKEGTCEQLDLESDISSVVEYVTSEVASADLTLTADLPAEAESPVEPSIENLENTSADGKINPLTDDTTHVSVESSNIASTDISVEVMSSDETSLHPLNENIEMSHTDGQLDLRSDINSISQVKEELSVTDESLVSQPVSTEIPAELLISEEPSEYIQTLDNQPRETLIENKEIGSTDVQLSLQPDVTRIIPLSEVSTESLPVPTEIPAVELLPSDETSAEIQTHCDETSEVLLEKTEMDPTYAQLDLHSDVTSIAQVTEESSVDQHVPTEKTAELLPSEESSLEIQTPSNETPEQIIENIEVGSTDEQVNMQHDVTAITQLTEISSESSPVSTEISAEVLPSEETSLEIQTPPNETPEPLIDEQVNMQHDVTTITQLTEESSESSHVSTEISAEVLPSDETTMGIQTPSNETTEQLIEKIEIGQLNLPPDVTAINQSSMPTDIPVEDIPSVDTTQQIQTPSKESLNQSTETLENESTDKQSVEISTAVPMSQDTNIDITEDIDKQSVEISTAVPTSVDINVEITESTDVQSVEISTAVPISDDTNVDITESTDGQSVEIPTAVPISDDTNLDITDGKSVEIPTAVPMSDDTNVEITEGIDVTPLETTSVSSTDTTHVALENNNKDSVTEINDAPIDMSLSEFTAMIAASDEKVGVNEPVLSNDDVIEPDRSQRELNTDDSQCGEEPSITVQCEEGKPINNGLDTVLVADSVQSELNGVEPAKPCESTTPPQESVTSLIENNNTHLGQSENEVIIGKREDELMQVNVKSQSDGKEISTVEEIPLDQHSNIKQGVNVDTKGSNEQIIIESITVGKEMHIQPLTVPTEIMNKHKDLNGTLDTSPEVNNGLPLNCINGESNCKLSVDGEVGSNDLLLSDNGIADRVIFV